MKKALNKIMDQIYRNSAPKGYRLTNRPSTKTLELIIHHSNGDIRSALMSLQFLASSPEAKSGVLSISGGPEVEMKDKGKKRKKDDDDGETEASRGIKKLWVSPINGCETRSLNQKSSMDRLSFVTARESSLFIFHALGKVLYSKSKFLLDSIDRSGTH